MIIILTDFGEPLSVFHHYPARLLLGGFEAPGARLPCPHPVSTHRF